MNSVAILFSVAMASIVIAIIWVVVLLKQLGDDIDRMDDLNSNNR